MVEVVIEDETNLMCVKSYCIGDFQTSFPAETWFDPLDILSIFHSEKNVRLALRNSPSGLVFRFKTREEALQIYTSILGEYKKGKRRK